MKPTYRPMKRANYIFSLFAVLFAVAAVVITFLLSESWTLRFSVTVLTAAMLFLFFLYYRFLWQQIASFSTGLCKSLDQMMDASNNPVSFYEERESLFSQVQSKLSQSYVSLQKRQGTLDAERKELQSLISDISHQVKTPVASLQSINATLLQHELTRQDRMKFLQAEQEQLDQLTFLMQSLVKSSRLETGVIVLKKEAVPLGKTIESALNSVLAEMDSKDLQLALEIDPKLLVPHDPKWTCEAIVNLLDNAVKYTQSSGHIRVFTKRWGLYAKIGVEDDGRVISEKHQAQIFQRFYREPEVHDEKGIGIGLYLAREIVRLQDGWIEVQSPLADGKGASFSIFLPMGRIDNS